MPGPVPGIHVFRATGKTWMAGTGPGTGPAMTSRGNSPDRDMHERRRGLLIHCRSIANVILQSVWARCCFIVFSLFFLPLYFSCCFQVRAFDRHPRCRDRLQIRCRSNRSKRRLACAAGSSRFPAPSSAGRSGSSTSTIVTLLRESCASRGAAPPDCRPGLQPRSSNSRYIRFYSGLYTYRGLMSRIKNRQLG